MKQKYYVFEAKYVFIRVISIILQLILSVLINNLK